MSRFTDWFFWSKKIQQNRSFEEPVENLTRKIVDIQGEVIPGWITIDIGYFDSLNVYYPSKTRSISIPIPQEFSSIIDQLLSASITDQDLEMLLAYAEQSSQMKDQWDGKV